MLLTLDNIGVEFGGRWLLHDASYQFSPGERVGLIGRNGAGKSTLLRIIAGKQEPTEGQVHRAGDLKLGYFHQELLSFETEQNIFEVAQQGLAPLLALRDEIDALLARIEGGDTDPKLWNELARLQALFETRGGDRIDATVHAMLSGLGFAAEEHDKPYATFSGGWRMRVLLARMLLAEPDLLLLDEPTNHLDLPSIEWLEGYLRNFRGCAVIVSHDRFFLDRMVNKVLEISLKRLHLYAGNYAFYLEEKELRREQQQREYENQQKYIAEQEAFINRFRAKATKARQAQSRIKALERLNRLEAPETEGFDFHLDFPVKKQSGKEVVRLRNISKSYGDKHILANSSCEILRGDKIALIGANGLGKSTLLRILLDREPHGGTVELGHNVRPTFFAQHQLEALDLENNILEEMATAARGQTEQELRTILGGFMFSGDEVEKYVRVLSGGEKSRLALAKTLLSDANFLLLDEPTNHLDIPSIGVLVEALRRYEGTYIVVSHDRYFLDQIANKIWYIEDRQVKSYPGTYAEFARWQEKNASAASENGSPPDASDTVEGGAATDKTSDDDGLSYEARKQRRNRQRKLEREVAEAETTIERLEGEVAAALEAMNDPEVAADYEKLASAQSHYESLKRQLDAETERWAELGEELEEI